MRDAVIVSSVRTAVGKAGKGTLRSTRPDDLAAIAIRAAIDRVPGLDPKEIDDVILGCAMPEAEQGMNVARIAALRAGLPVETSAMTINRFCSSGLQAIAQAAERIMLGGAEVILAGGTESMSLVPMGGNKVAPNPWLMDHYPDAYLGMGLTAENLARKYSITRQEADEFSYASHQKALAAIAAGKFKDEIVPVEVRTTIVSNGRRPRRARQDRHLHFRDRRRPARRYLRRSAGEAEARLPRARHRHRRQQLADERRRRRSRGHERRSRPRAGREAAGALCGLRHRRRSARRNGHRPGPRHSQGS